MKWDVDVNPADCIDYLFQVRPMLMVVVVRNRDIDQLGDSIDGHVRTADVISGIDFCILNSLVPISSAAVSRGMLTMVVF